MRFLLCIFLLVGFIVERGNSEDSKIDTKAKNLVFIGFFEKKDSLFWSFWQNVSSIFQPWKDSIHIKFHECPEKKCFKKKQFVDVPSVKPHLPYASLKIRPIPFKEKGDNILREIFKIIEFARISEISEPDKYPDLTPILEVDVKLMPDKYIPSVLLFESNPIFFWSELIVILFSRDTPYHFKIVRTTDKSHEVIASIMHRKGGGSQGKILKGNEFKSYASRVEEVSIFLRKHIYSNRNALDTSNGNPYAASTYYFGIKDLEQIIHQILTKQIAVGARTDKVKSELAKSFLVVLSKYAPVDVKVNHVLKELSVWANGEVNLSGFTVKLTNLTTTFSVFKNLTKASRHCYPITDTNSGLRCWMWSLFYTLVTHAAKHEDDGASAIGGSNGECKVMLAIRDYLVGFHFCDTCVVHALAKMRKIEFPLDTYLDVILWVWRMHNLIILDEFGKKNQSVSLWPFHQDCPHCRNLNGDLELVGERWDHYELLNFITLFHGEYVFKKEFKGNVIGGALPTHGVHFVKAP